MFTSSLHFFNPTNHMIYWLKLDEVFFKGNTHMYISFELAINMHPILVLLFTNKKVKESELIRIHTIQIWEPSVGLFKRLLEDADVL